MSKLWEILPDGVFTQLYSREMGPCSEELKRYLKVVSEKQIVHVAEVNQLRCYEESEQLTENVDRTHLG